MSSTADADDVIEVSADGLTVRKRFTADEFPVPAIRFEIESDHDEQVTFRLSETIPESFPMDKVGFHPDYHSDDWTAFQDHHVEFTSTLEPDERLVTVYGIRVDDESAAAEFLSEPTIVEVSSESSAGSDADEIDDDVIGTIVSEDSNQAVKDMIAGDSESVPGLEDDAPADDGDDTGEDEEAAGLDLDLDDVDTDPVDVDAADDEDAPDIDLGFEEDELPDADGDEAAEDEATADGETVDAADAAESESGEELEPDDDSPEPAVEAQPDATADGERDDAAAESDSESTTAAPAGETATAASEPETPDESGDSEDGTSDDATEPVSTVEFEGSIAARLATEIREEAVDEDDLEALRGALDLEPSGVDLARVDHLQSRVEEVAAYTGALEEFLDEQGTGVQLIEELQAELSAFEEEVASVDDRLEDAEDRVDAVETDVDSLTDWTADLETELDETTDDVESVEESVDDLADDVDELEDDVEAVRADVTDIQDWRDQLGSMFSDS